MTEDEKIHNIDSRVSNLETKFEIHMRRQDELAADIREIRQDMKDMQKNFDAKIDKLDTKIDGIGKHVQNLSVAAMVGVGTSVVSIGAIAVTVIYSVLMR